MSEKVLVTGGAGFIGSHVVDRLLAAGKEVLVLDNLEAQVHGPGARRPAHLAERAELVIGDVRNRKLVFDLVGKADAVVHLAAAVGLAQSMYEMDRFIDINSRGTAIVLEAATQKTSRVRKLLLASSMSLYGEGRCSCAEHGPFDPALRPRAQLDRHDFEIYCPQCGKHATPAPTPETARLVSTTVYAVSKRDQEDLCLAVGAAYKLPVVTLRLFNVYGPRQALSNPYTGVGAIFSGKLLAGKQPMVFEDGLQTRDFTHVSDVAEAFALALDRPGGDGGAYNVGAGRAYTLLELGQMLAQQIGVEWRPEITRQFREGDIRHCTADGTRLAAALGFRPRVDFKDGVRDLVGWVRTQQAGEHGDRSMAELKAHGLLR